MLRFADSVFAALASRRLHCVAQEPVRTDTTGADTTPGYQAAGARGYRDPDSRAAEPGALSPWVSSTGGEFQRGQQTVGHRRGAEQPARRRGREPVQLLARSADLDSGLRQPVELRGARAQDPARRHPTDTPRRPEPADQHRLRRPGPRRGAARGQLLALRQRLRRRDLVPDPARRPGTVRPARPGAGGQRRAGERRLLQVAELDLGPIGQRERHALPLAVQGGRVPPAQRRGDPAAQRRAGLRLRRVDAGHGAA